MLFDKLRHEQDVEDHDGVGAEAGRGGVPGGGFPGGVQHRTHSTYLCQAQKIGRTGWRSQSKGLENIKSASPKIFSPLASNINEILMEVPLT